MNQPGDAEASWLPIGVLGKPHGVHGAAYARLYNPSSDAFEHVERIRLEKEGRSVLLVVERAQHQAKGVLVQLAGLATREAVAAWTSAEISVERSSLPPLEPGEYYLADLVGCEVYAGARRVGEITGVRADPSCDTAQIRAADGSEIELVLVPDFVATVDVGARRVELSGEEGLIEP